MTRSSRVRRITEDVWYAGDGTMFLSEAECREYEQKTGIQRLEDMVSGLPHFNDCPEFACCNEEWIWYRISNPEELDAVRKILFGRHSAVWDYAGPERYPCWIAFSMELCGDGSGSVLGTPGDLDRKFEDYMSRVKNQIQKRDAEAAA